MFLVVNSGDLRPFLSVRFYFSSCQAFVDYELVFHVDEDTGFSSGVLIVTACLE